MNIRDRLKARRVELGWSLRAAAERIGIPYGTLGQYETGVTQPTLERLEQWAAGLGMDLFAADALVWEASPLPYGLRDVEAELTEAERRLVEAVVATARERKGHKVS